MAPETRYARSGDVAIAWQVVGDGPLDLLVVPGWVSHVEYAWEVPAVADFLKRLASFSRLMLLDRRGTGLSDRVVGLPTLEQRMDDVRAVMDAAGSRQAALVGISEGGPMCILFAATYPERTTALVLCGTMATGRRQPDYPWAPPEAAMARFLDTIDKEWGTGFTARRFAPTIAEDPDQIRQWATYERRAVSPGGMRSLLAIARDTDVREVLPAVRVPTLVVHRTDDRVVRVGGARYLADHIPGAELVELPGTDHFPWVGDVDALLGPIERFLTGAHTAGSLDRVLSTITFCDIVDSTERAAALGDRSWHALLERYYAIVRVQLDVFRGREIDTAGDGHFAAFDGPARAIRFACAVRDGVEPLGLEVRVGIHAGECERIGDKLGGIAVHIGARIGAEAAPREVLVSGTVKDLVVGSGIDFVERGARVLKGIPGEWRLFAVADRSSTKA